MFIQGVAVPDTARVQQDGVDQIVVGWRPFPICNRVQMMLNHALKIQERLIPLFFAFDNQLTQFPAFKIRRNAGCFCKVLFLVNLAIDTEWSSTLYMNMLK